PSVVPIDQLQVPLFVPVFVTVPTDAVIATLSPESGSEYVPVFVAVAPSFTVRDALSAAMVGALFELTKCAYASEMFPFVPAASVEMQGVGVPGMSVPESVLLSPLVHLLNVFPVVVVVTESRRTDLPVPPKPGMFTEPPEVAVTVE